MRHVFNSMQREKTKQFYFLGENDRPVGIEIRVQYDFWIRWTYTNIFRFTCTVKIKMERENLIIIINFNKYSQKGFSVPIYK